MSRGSRLLNANASHTPVSALEKDRPMKNGSGISRRTFLGAVGASAGITALAPLIVRAQAPAAGKPADPASTITTPPRDFGPNAPPITYVDPDVITIVPHPDGSYWFTDPPYGGQLYEGAPDAPGGRGLGYSGVTVWTPAGKLIGRIRLPE